MFSIRAWNRRQLCVFQRYSRFYGLPLSPDLVIQLAQRYARKHAGERLAS